MLKRALRHLCLYLLSILITAAPALCASYYTQRPSDPSAVVLSATAFPVSANGIRDDASAIQMAIDRVAAHPKGGILFIPQGRYRLGHTLYVWSGVRLIGYGAQRPVFVLGPHTPGYEIGGGRYLVQFAGQRPPAVQAIHDPEVGPFYSGMSNIDIEIDRGNPAAIGIRFHAGTQCLLSHIDFHVAGALAGIQNVGGQGQDLRFYGGQYGIITSRTQASQPFVLVDSLFSGQSKAAIKTQEAGLTLVRDQFKGLPTAVSLDDERVEELWMKDCRCQNLSGPALLISSEDNPRTQINVQAMACAGVPLFALLRESGTQVTAPAPIYLVNEFCHGLQIDDLGGMGTIKTTYKMSEIAQMPPAVASDIPTLPAAQTWTNIKALGARGDGIADDTAVFKQAISKYQTIYLPSGRYKITNTLALLPQTVLIGLDPATTQIVLPDNAKAFVGWGAKKGSQGIGGPKAMIVAPRYGTNIVTGIGFDPGDNLRAVAVKWMAGPNSLLSDARFLTTHAVYNPLVDPDMAPSKAERPADSQYPSLWISDGGGGVFQNIWSSNSLAQSGVTISNTSTVGHIYGLCVEYHARSEVRIKNVSNWEIDALCTKEDPQIGRGALPLDIDQASNVTFANILLERAAGIWTPFPYAVQVRGAHDVRFKCARAQSPSQFAFDDMVYDQNSGIQVRDRQIASLTLSGQPPLLPPPLKSAIRDADSKPVKLAGGFSNIEGAAADTNGNLYFVDARRQSIYRWSEETGMLTLVRDDPLAPAQLAIDPSGNLIVMTGMGYVYSLRPDSDTDSQITPIAPVAAAVRPGLVAYLPASRWSDADNFSASAKPLPLQYVSPDGSIFIPAGADFPNGGVGSDPAASDPIRAYSLAAAVPGKPFYVADEYASRTWAFSVSPDGSLTHPRLFANRGETGAVVDALGDVYVAAGQIFVYDPLGRQIDLIDVPERPSCLVFGGKDHQTLFICARTSLYALRLKVKGQ